MVLIRHNTRAPRFRNRGARVLCRFYVVLETAVYFQVCVVAHAVVFLLFSAA